MKIKEETHRQEVYIEREGAGADIWREYGNR
jgi:hypothetical protein